MAAEFLNAWRPEAIAAAHTALLALLDAETDPASITLHSDDDTLLAEVPLTNPSGTVASGNGSLTLTPDGRDESAAASGQASYATLRDGAGVAYRSFPCKTGSAADPGWCVMNTTNIIAGGPVEILSLVIA